MKNTPHIPSNNNESERILKNNGFISRERVLGNLPVTRSVGDFRFKSNHKNNYGTLLNNTPELIQYEFN